MSDESESPDEDDDSLFPLEVPEPEPLEPDGPFPEFSPKEPRYMVAGRLEPAGLVAWIKEAGSTQRGLDLAVVGEVLTRVDRLVRSAFRQALPETQDARADLSVPLVGYRPGSGTFAIDLPEIYLTERLDAPEERGGPRAILEELFAATAGRSSTVEVVRAIDDLEVAKDAWKLFDLLARQDLNSAWGFKDDGWIALSATRAKRVAFELRSTSQVDVFTEVLKGYVYQADGRSRRFRLARAQNSVVLIDFTREQEAQVRTIWNRNCVVTVTVAEEHLELGSVSRTYSFVEGKVIPEADTDPLS